MSLLFGHRLQSRREDTAAPTETKVEEPINEDTADADITKEEAQAFFEEITDSVYYHLLEIPVDDLQTGIQPYYWIWIAAPEQEAVLDDFTNLTSLRKRSIHTAATAASCPTRHIPKAMSRKAWITFGERKPSPGKKPWDSKNPP